MATAKPIKKYNFANQSIIVGGRNLTGFDDDGTVEYEPQSGRWSHSVGSDGQTTISRVNDPRVIATLTVKETGKAYEILAQLHAQQRAIDPDPVTYKHRDPFVGDRVNSGSAYFLNNPTIEKAKEAGSREFTILLPNGLKNGVVMADQNPAPGFGDA